MKQRTVVFFDIDGTLANTELREYGLHMATNDYIPAGLHLAVYKYIPAVLDQLAGDHDAVFGIISDTHGGDENASERHALNNETIRALKAAGLLQRLENDLVFLSSETGLRKHTLFPFELAAARAARVVGVLPDRCVFVGENRMERGRARDAGMRTAPHPLLASAVVADNPLLYLNLELTNENGIGKLADSVGSLPVLVLYHSRNSGFVLLVGTKEAADALRERGFSVQMLCTQADPALFDAFLFCTVTRNCSRVLGSNDPPAAHREIAAVPDGHVLGLGPDEPIADRHIVKRHGHVLKIAPNSDLCFVDQAGFPDIVKSIDSRVPCEQLAHITQSITPRNVQKYIDKYSGRNLNAQYVTRNRHIRSPDMPKVIDALVADFEAIGQDRIHVSKQLFNLDDSLELYNVVAELPGSNDEIVLITAHLDSTAAETYGRAYNPAVHDAPGADDDASGIAGVICAAHAFSSCYLSERPRRTVRFVLFNAEEAGMIGSRHYAWRQRQMGAKIVAVFQLDMIGYDVEPPKSWEVHAGHCNTVMRTQSLIVASTVCTAAHQLKEMGAVTVDLPQIFPEIRDGTWDPDPASGRSDHGSFQDLGYPACAISGDFFKSHGALSAERNPNYHRATDTRVSFTYAADLSRCVVAAALSYTR